MSTTKAPEAIFQSLSPNFSNKEIVQSSARLHDRLEHQGVQTTKSRERKLGAYFFRLEELEQDSKTKERLIEHVTNELVVKPENIPESYWSQQVQLARDNGFEVNIGPSSKAEVVRQLQGSQRTGIESWTEYLNQTSDQYPTWFKVYALDGMSKLGVFDKKTGRYRTRDESTIAPFPQLDPSALARTYDAVKKVHGENEQLDDATLLNSVQGGNFNKIYSSFLLENKAVIPTPERPEDVRGEWRQYTANDVKAITQAAQGTPWCIAGEEMAQKYLSFPDSKFILFHLKDSQTGSLSPTAAASIRMAEGRVAEISGLKGGSRQYVEDSLIPTVVEKVKSLPGGEDYLDAFEDKQTLIAMDRKFQAGEQFTIDELRFLYEFDEKIKFIDTYARDPRPIDFKTKITDHIKQFQEAGLVDELVPALNDWERGTYISQLLEAGADVNNLVAELNPGHLSGHLKQLLQAGADVNHLVAHLDTYTIIFYLSDLREAGAHIDMDSVVASTEASYFDPYNIERVLSGGASVKVVEKKIGRPLTDEEKAYVSKPASMWAAIKQIIKKK